MSYHIFYHCLADLPYIIRLNHIFLDNQYQIQSSFIVLVSIF